MFRKLIKFENNSEDPNLLATLSLYLLLLAFFVMLDSLADREQTKAEAVLKSINSSFYGKIEVKNPKAQSRYEKNLDKPDSKNRVVDDIGRLFEEVIPVAEVAWDQNQNKLRIALPIDRLFLEKDKEMSPRLDAIFKRFLSALAKVEENGGVTELSLLYGLEKEQTLAPRPSLVTKRLDHIVNRFEDDGYPREQISVGLLPLDGQRFYLDLYLYQEAPEVLSFDDEALR